jgi:hypothetical protein
MSITTELSRRRFAIGDATRTLRSHFGALVARNKDDLLILCAFAAVGLVVMIFALSSLPIWTDPDALSVLS